MYPETPKMTKEQREKLIELLKSIGSGGKGCRFESKEAESGQNREIHRVLGVPAQYFAESGTGVKGTISHMGGGSSNQEECNK